MQAFVTECHCLVTFWKYTGFMTSNMEWAKQNQITLYVNILLVRLICLKFSFCFTSSMGVNGCSPNPSVNTYVSW